MRDEYDISEAIRADYLRRLGSDRVAVVLDPDVADVFHDAQAVNDALRALAAIIRRHRTTAS